MDKTEGITACTALICCAIVMFVLIIAGADCTKHIETKESEVRRSALEREDGTTIIFNGP